MPPSRKATRSSPDDVLAGRRSVVELLRAGKPAREIRVARETGRAKTVSEIRDLARKSSIPVREVPAKELDELVPGTNHQGVVALTARYRYSSMEDIISASAPILFLDGVMDTHNLGSLLRSADGAGFGGVVLPAHGSASVTAAVRRVSSGAAEVVPVARVTNLSRAMDEAKRAGLWVAGLDAGADEDLWASELLDPPVALVLGSEDRGLSRGVRAGCDGLVRIPGHGRLESLNVSVAGAIAMFEVARRHAGSANV